MSRRATRAAHCRTCVLRLSLYTSFAYLVTIVVKFPGSHGTDCRISDLACMYVSSLTSNSPIEVGTGCAVGGRSADLHICCVTFHTDFYSRRGPRAAVGITQYRRHSLASMVGRSQWYWQSDASRGVRPVAGAPKRSCSYSSHSSSTSSSFRSFLSISSFCSWMSSSCRSAFGPDSILRLRTGFAGLPATTVYGFTS